MPPTNAVGAAAAGDAAHGSHKADRLAGSAIDKFSATPNALQGGAR